ncbi:putative Ig domain-containing protein [Catenuloplanes atrovinosus]|uniref:Prepilin-type N-terminal cleavage/methylation domain-containing protein n=1 Tax=Catenuloplanes atrovinosus TaxID=137266 RepID=A0AAE3YLH5_9ACTN|nr:putative Ig domain-containing protein [Catenuloplanes atrovinosus]MDR7274630.1 prepilin-type N-terminal cleavage/methylation domain-containing protein [Catenuloplanes atrovinosus]
MRAVTHRRTRPPAPAADAGFTLVETIVAIGIVGVVMTALGTFFVSSMRTTSNQAGTQAAVQVASDAMERVRSLMPTKLANNRDQQSSTQQWASPVAGVAPWLAGMEMAYDATAAAGDGASAPMPTSPLTVTLAGVQYRQNFYLGRCWQVARTGGACTTTKPADPVEFFRVVVGVTWPDHGCANGTCSYVTTTLISNSELEPNFDTNDQAIPPQIVAPGGQADDVNTAVSLQLQANGGTAPLNWVSAEGLPPTMSMNSSGLITGTTPATPGTHTITVTVQDDYDLINTGTFTWTVNPLPTVQPQADLNSQGGVAITPLTLRVNNGTAAYSWAATGLPPGLSLSASTGVISGTPNRVGVYTVVTTVTDKNGNTATDTFVWTVPPLTVVTPGALVLVRGQTMTPVTVTASGGVQNSSRQYAWTATGLPLGVTLNATTGVISGRPSTAGTYRIVVTVRDSQLPQNTASTNEFTWRVQ